MAHDIQASGHPQTEHSGTPTCTPSEQLMSWSAMAYACRLWHMHITCPEGSNTGIHSVDLARLCDADEALAPSMLDVHSAGGPMQLGITICSASTCVPGGMETHSFLRPQVC